MWGESPMMEILKGVLDVVLRVVGALSVPLLVVFLSFDLSYFGSCLLKFFQGGWFPLAVGGMAAALSDQDIADIAVYLQSLPVPPTQGQGPGTDLVRGRQLYDRDCSICHGQRGQGKGDQFFPRVSGQHYLYLLREGRAFRDGQRRNVHPEMAAAISKYTDDELTAVSDHMSRLPVAGP